MSKPRPTPAMVAGVAVGGALGACLRWSLDATTGAGTGPAGDFPWTTLAINVLGAFALAALPAVVPTPTAAQRASVLAVALGPGLLGGFTTMSAAAEQTRALVSAGSALGAGLYVLGTVLAAVAAVRLAGRFEPAPAGDELG